MDTDKAIMTNLRIPYNGSTRTYGKVISSSNGTSLGTGYTQLVASTDYDMNGLHFQGYKEGGSNPGTAQTLVTLGIGPSGSERVLCNGLIFPRTDPTPRDDAPGLVFNLPLRVPRGSRLSAKYSSAGAGQGVRALVTGQITGPISSDLCFDAGIPEGLTDAHGVTVDPGATANALGAWSEITAASAQSYGAIMVVLGSYPKSFSDTRQQTQIDIGIGPSGSERVIIDGLLTRYYTDRWMDFPSQFGPFYLSIPAGTRIAARARSSDNNAGSRTFDLTIIGFAQ